ncbi:DUF2793 domain-containing protein [Rhizobiales bacterium 3FA27D7]|jgi:hypothetical protein|uniref:DUF2793 domain-containing protein n=1 Tax=Mesorhizobium sp. 2RAF21 TaxID=3232995 RepID=UPI0010FA4331
MPETLKLKLQTIAPDQAQKHIPVNEALHRLDALVQLAVLDRDLTVPPAAPSEGDRYIPASGASGVWLGWDFNIALFADGVWTKIVPRQGWLCFVADEGLLLVHSGTAWRETAAVGATIASESPNGARNVLAVAETLVSGLSGAFADTVISIPNRAIVFCVSTRTVTAITGAASYDCGLAGERSKFGGSLSIAAGSNNAGVIGPTAFYADTPVRLSANGGNFTGGAVRVAIHYILPRVPQT